MRGSFRFARVFGIDLKIHFTFLIIVLIAAMQGRGSIESMIFGVAFILLVFVCVTLHELGHAITAWWCGFSAIPTFWKTLIGETRSTGVTLLLAAALAAGAWWAWTTDRMVMVGAIAGLGALAFLATTADADWAAAAIIFAGDAGALVLGTALMLAFAAGGPDSWLRRGQLRWGFLAIGAAAFVDTAAMWWQARSCCGWHAVLALRTSVLPMLLAHLVHCSHHVLQLAHGPAVGQLLQDSRQCLQSQAFPCLATISDRTGSDEHHCAAVWYKGQLADLMSHVLDQGWLGAAEFVTHKLHHPQAASRGAC